jgi:hypothetical protein
MKRNILLGTAILLTGLHGCTRDAVTAGTYEAIYQKQCMDQSGEPNCDPDHQTYNAYQKDRDEVLKK